MNKRIALALVITFLLAMSINFSIMNIGQSALPADSMYIIQSLINYAPSNASVGMRFNVTIWLNNTTPANNWQYYIVYNKAQLNATRCGYTGNGKSLWSGALPVDSVTPSFGDHNATYKYALLGEVLKTSAQTATSASISWVEFQIMAAPNAGETLASTLSLDLKGVFESAVYDKDFNALSIAFGNALYRFSNPLPPQQKYQLSIEIPIGGTTNPAPGNYTYDKDTPVSVTALPDATHLFDHWNLDGINGGTSNPLTVTMSQNHTVTAIFAAKPPPGVNYTLTVTSTAGGTTNPSIGSHSYSNGTIVAVTALPDASHIFNHWTLDSVNSGSTNPISVTMNQNHALQAFFDLKPPPNVNYTLTIIASTGGTTNPAPGSYVYPSGTVVSITGNPNAGYRFDHWVINGVSSGSTNPISITVSMNQNISAVFTISPPSTALINVEASGAFDYKHNENIKVTISAFVTDENGQPVSDASVRMVIYSPHRYIVDSCKMTQITKGLYVWQSRLTAGQMYRHGGQGVYIALIKATYQDRPTAYETIEFHIDPPDEASSVGNPQLPIAPIALGSALVLLFAIAGSFIYIRKKSKR